MVMQMPESIDDRIERKFLQKRIACQRAEIRRLLIIEHLYWKRVHEDRERGRAAPVDPDNGGA